MREAGFDGAITLIGGEIHLPYERPSLFKELLASEAEPEPVFVKSNTWYSKNTVTCLLWTTASNINRSENLVGCEDGQCVFFNRPLLATGDVTRRLQAFGDNLGEIHYLHSLTGACHLRRAMTTARRMVVIGGGLISREVTASAQKRDISVCVTEAGQLLAGRLLPSIICDRIWARHRVEDFHVYLDATVVRFSGDRVVERVELADGRRIDADLVVVGIGMIPSTALAKTAGIEVADGIKVDKYCETSTQNIFTAGDCALSVDNFCGCPIRLESWMNARNQAIAAGYNMSGESRSYWEPPSGWSVQYDMMIQFVGAPMVWSNPVIRKYSDDSELVLLLENGVVIAAADVNCSKDMAWVRRLVTARIRVERNCVTNLGLSLNTVALGK